MMDTKPYKQQVATGMEQIRNLQAERKGIDEKICKFRDLIRANANLLPDEEKEATLAALDEILEPMGLTAATRRVLRSAGQAGLTPREVRDKVADIGFDLRTQSNPLASIHTVLKRLVASEEARIAIRDINGEHDESVYQWIPEGIKLERTILGAFKGALIGGGKGASKAANIRHESNTHKGSQKE